MSEREDAVRQMIEDATRDFFDRYDVLYKEQYDRAEALEREAIELRERNEKLTEALRKLNSAIWLDNPKWAIASPETGRASELIADEERRAALSTGEDTE